MSDEHILRYTDLAAVIQMAKARGWPTSRIVREMSSGLPYLQVLRLARKAAPLLDLCLRIHARAEERVMPMPVPVGSTNDHCNRPCEASRDQCPRLFSACHVSAPSADC